MAATTMAVAYIAGTAYTAYSAGQERRKAAKAAAKPKTTTITRSPYMEEMIKPMFPYIANEALNVYNYRSGKGNGPPAGNYDQLRDMLTRIMSGQDYSGISSGQQSYDQTIGDPRAAIGEGRFVRRDLIDREFGGGRQIDTRNYI